MVFLSATGTTPAYYTTILSQAAASSSTITTNFATIGLAYFNGVNIFAGSTINNQCNPNGVITTQGSSIDNCFTQARGEVVFGRNATYPGWPAGKAYNAFSWPSSNNPPVSQGDSIVNRLVLLLDYLTWQSGSYDPYRGQYLLTDTTCSPSAASCYAPVPGTSQGSATPACFVAPHNTSGGITYSRKVVPDWSKIIIAGHSQGGGMAAFLAMNLPLSTPTKRVVMFSSPQDNLINNQNSGTVTPNQTTTASWIKASSTATPATSFWGLRNGAGNSDTAEGVYGNNVANSWKYFASIGIGGAAGSTPSSAGDGSAGPTNTSSHNIYITSPSTTTDAIKHCSTAMDVYYKSTVFYTWAWLFTGGGSTL